MARGRKPLGDRAMTAAERQRRRRERRSRLISINIRIAQGRENEVPANLPHRCEEILRNCFEEHVEAGVLDIRHRRTREKRDGVWPS